MTTYNKGSAESKRQLAALSKTLQAYLAAFNEVAIVTITDLNGNLIYVNDKFIEISQYSREELLGKTHRVVNSGYHSKDFFAEMWNTISSGKPWRAEIKNKAKDGTFYWVDTVITPVKDDNDQIFQYLSIRNQITWQKEHEEKLAAAKKALLRTTSQLNEAQMVAKTGSWYHNTTIDELEWSDETFRIFEIPPAEPMSYEKFLEKIHPDDLQKVNEQWEQALRTGFYEVEHRIITAGGIKWVHEKAKLEFDENAKLNTVLGTIQDITEKKKTEESLKESEALYRELFNDSPFAIGLMDTETTQFLEVNQTAVELYGYSREEFLSMNALDVRLPEDREKVEEELKTGFYSQHKSIRPHLKKNGEIILVEPTITAINFKGRKVFLVTIKDMTEKMKAQEELAAQKSKHRKALDRAKLEAEEKIRAGIGRELHDNINQLLVASTLFFKKVKVASPDDEALVKSGIGIISNAIEEIRKLSSSFVPPSLKTLTLEDSIEFLVKSIKLSGTYVRLDINIIEEQLEDAFKINLYRIIQEQFNNIIKYAHASEALVRISQDENSLRLEVSDNGHGFDTKQKSTGIGLANIKHRASLYNGRASIISSPGHGCSIVINFKLQ